MPLQVEKKAMVRSIIGANLCDKNNMGRFVAVAKSFMCSCFVEM